jgi:hypothetical protein
MINCENVTELDTKEDVYVKIRVTEIQLKVADFVIFVWWQKDLKNEYNKQLCWCRLCITYNW